MNENENNGFNNFSGPNDNLNINPEISNDAAGMNNQIDLNASNMNNQVDLNASGMNNSINLSKPEDNNAYTPDFNYNASGNFSADANNYSTDNNNYNAGNYSSDANNYNAGNYSSDANNYNTNVNTYSADANNYNTQAAPVKKKKKGLVGLLIALGLLVLAGVFAFLFFFTTAFKTPKQKVMLAISKTLGNQSLIAELSGNTKDGISKGVINTDKNALSDASAFLTDSLNGSSKIDFEIELSKFILEDEKVYTQLYGGGIATSTSTDLDNRLTANNTIIKYNGTNLLDFNFYLDNDKFMVESKDFLDGYFSVNTEDFGKQYKKSYIKEMVDSSNSYLSDVLSDISFNAYDYLEEQKENNASSKLLENPDELMDAYKNFYDGIIVAKTEPATYAKYEINGKDVKAYAYTVTIPEDVTTAFIDEISPIILDVYEEQLKSRVNQMSALNNMDYDDVFKNFKKNYKEMVKEIKKEIEDVELKVYIDNKCRLIAVNYTGTFDGNGTDTDIEFNMDFAGYPYLCDDIYANLVVDSKSKVEFVMNYVADKDSSENIKSLNVDIFKDDEKYGTISYDNTYDSSNGAYDLAIVLDMTSADEKLALTSNGTIEFKDKTFSLDFDKLTLSNIDNGEKTEIAFNGNYSVTTDFDDIELPSGKEYELLKLDETDLYGLVFDISNNVSSSPLMQFIESQY